MPKKEQPTVAETTPIPTETKSNNFMRSLGIGIVALLLFASGWSFGKGNFSLQSLTKKQPAHVNLANFDEVYDVVSTLQDNYDGTVDSTKLLDSLKEGVAKSTGDPYTEYFNAEDSKSFSEELSGSFEGIGAELGKDGSNIVIISPLAGSPAEKAGLKAKDIIIKIDDLDATDITVTEAVKHIRGKAGTDVKLTLARDGAKVEATITRGTITIPSVKWEIKDGIGIMTVSRFGDDTADLSKQAANEFIAANVKGVVLDLRNNPGGFVTSAVDLSSLWLDKGKTVLLEKRGGKVQRTYTALGDPILHDKKTVVLINGGSASASEITAGALHDNGVATLMGEKSYGKGSMQQIFNLAGGGTLKVTMARWYTPNDKNIDKEGIKPDKEVKLTDEDAKNKNDTQLQAALSVLK